MLFSKAQTDAGKPATWAVRPQTGSISWITVAGIFVLVLTSVPGLRGIALFKALLRYRKQLRLSATIVALAASLVLVWFTVHAPERDRNLLVTRMEQESAQYFATERDIGALARDANSGAASSIGLSVEYALVGLADGGRYYVRIDTQRALVTDLLKDRMSSATPLVFALNDIAPPGGPLTVFSRQVNAGHLSLLGPILIIYLIVMMNRRA